MKRVLALLLCLSLCLSLIPAAAAEDIELIEPEETEDAAPIEIIDPIAAAEAAEPADEPSNEPADEPVEESTDEIALAGEADAVAPGADEIQATIGSGSCGDNLTWSLNSDGYLFISGSGPMTDYTRGTAPWYEYRAQIKELYVYGGTTIGDYAFVGCSYLTLPADNGKSFPSSLTSIGKCAFLSCSSLEYVTIPSGVTSIGNQAFDYCNGLKRVTVCGAPTLGSWAFGDCPALEEISFLGGVPTFSEKTFDGSHAATAWYPPDKSAWTSDVLQNYGGTLTWQAGYHGWMGDDITWDLNASTGVLSLSGSGTNWWFGSAGKQSWLPVRGKVKTVSVGSGITVLDEYALSNLYNMTSVSLPDTLTEIGYEVFLGDSSLTSITIPKSVTKLGYMIFNNCSALKEVRFLGHAPESINAKAFSGVTATVYYYPVYTWTTDTMQQYGGTLTWSCDNKVGTNAYWKLYDGGLLQIYGAVSGFATDDFPSEYPNFYGFRDEITLAQIDSTCTRAGNYLFYDLDKLEKVIILGQTDLGNHCFGRCFALKEIRFCDKAPTISASAFNGVTATAYYLPIADGGWSSDVTQNYGGTITWVCDNQVGDNVTWSIDASGTLTLTGTGPTWDYDYTNHPGYYYISLSVKSLTVGEGITTIGKNLFEDLDQLTSVSLPDTLTTISSTAFASCGVLSSITIPKSVTTIGASAFSNCKKLTEVRFLGHAPTIASTAFNNVTATAYYYPVYSWTEDKMTQPSSGSLTWVKDDKIGDDVTWRLEEGGYLYLEGAGPTWDFNSNEPGFYNFRDEVKFAYMDDDVSALGQYLFWQMNKMESITIPHGVTALGERAFSGCTALTIIAFYGHAPSFGSNCFAGVTATALIFPVYSWTDDVKQNYGGTITWDIYDEIGDDVTWKLYSDGWVYINGTGATDEFGGQLCPLCFFRDEISSVMVDNSVTALGSNIFEGLDKLKTVELLGSIQSVGNNLFLGCSALETVRFLGHAPTISSGAFRGVTVEAHYFPVYSWTEDKRQNYEGSVTWVCDDKIGDDVTWYLAENGKLSITGTGATWDYFSATPNFYRFRSEVKTAEIGAGVTGVGHYLFFDMDALEIVVLGPDVETIGYWAFDNCNALTEIRFQGEAPSFASNCFNGVTATAYYPVDDPSWTEDVRQDYGGHITWVPYGGYPITVANYTKGITSTSLAPGVSYSGVQTFTVTSTGDKAVLVAIKNGEDDYTILECTTVGSEHRYTVMVGEELEIVIALKGDVNLDGKVALKDNLMLKKHIAGTEKLAGLAFLVGDVDGSGTIKLKDTLTVKKVIAGTASFEW